MLLPRNLPLAGSSKPWTVRCGLILVRRPGLAALTSIATRVRQRRACEACPCTIGSPDTLIVRGHKQLAASDGTKPPRLCPSNPGKTDILRAQQAGSTVPGVPVRRNAVSAAMSLPIAFKAYRQSEMAFGDRRHYSTSAGSTPKKMYIKECSWALRESKSANASASSELFPTT